MIERDRELDLLGQALDRASAGFSQTVIVRGPVASGKTELVRVWAEHARLAETRVLYAIGSPATHRQPQSVLRQLLELPGNGDPPDDRAEPTAQAYRGALLDLSQDGALVLCVDDVQHCDAASLDVLLSLSNSWSGARILVVLTERTGMTLSTVDLDRNLPYDHEMHDIHLAMLSPAGTALLIGRAFGRSVEADDADAWHEATGGNPALINALTANRRVPPGHPLPEPVDSDSETGFARAILRCLRRSDPEALRAAKALAILGHMSTQPLLSALLGISAECADRTINSLAAMGLIDVGQLRNAAITAAIRSGMTPTECSDLRIRAARYLYDDGAPAVWIAALIELGGGVRDGWAIRALLEAYRQCLAGARNDAAIRYLKLAQRLAEPGRERDSATAALIRAEWLRDPPAVARYAAELADSAAVRRLAEGDLAVLIKHLLWNGMLDKAVDLLAAQTQEIGSAVPTVETWWSFLYPDLARHPMFGRWQSVRGSVPVAAPDAPSTVAALLFGELEAVLPGTDDVLRGDQIGGSALPRFAMVLMTFIYTERLPEAERLCARLLDACVDRRTPLWAAVIRAFQAEIALRTGDPVTAERLARMALAEVAPESWGVALGGPASTLALALVEQGRAAEAKEYVEFAFRDQMYQTLVGPHLLMARGAYSLAMDEPYQALMYFGWCGDLLTKWGLDRPGVLPWRIGCAEAHLRLGQHTIAEELLQADPATPAGRLPRQRGQAVHLLAAIGSGEPARRPWPVPDQPATGWPPVLPTPGKAGPGGCGGMGGLTDAERRVAEIVAAGKTNREIAVALSVTVSTVEQHLTRIYRKLKISGRSELVRQL